MNEPGTPRPRRAVTAGDELVVFIAAEPGLADRLLAQHIPDDHGRCRACPNGTATNAAWPCSLHDAAARAKEAVAKRPVDARGQRASRPSTAAQLSRSKGARTGSNPCQRTRALP